MDRVAEDLKVRTKVFAVKVLEFVETLPRGAAEFTARPGIVLDEADESELWTEVTADRSWGDAAQRAWLLDESRQLRSIFSKAVMTAKFRERHP